MNNFDSLSARPRETKNHLTRWFNSALLFALLTTGVAGCSAQPTAETNGQSMPVAIDITAPPGSAVPLPDNICAVTGRSFASILENIPQGFCTLDLIMPGGTEVNPQKIKEAQQASREQLQDEHQKLIDDAEFEQEQRAEVAIALANVPTPTPTPLPTPIVIQAVPTPAKPIPGDKEFKSKFFNAPIPTETPSPEKLAVQAALDAALARGPGAMVFGLPPTAGAQTEWAMPPLRSLLDPFATAQPVAGTSTQALAQPTATEISADIVISPSPTARATKPATEPTTEPTTEPPINQATDLDTEQPSVDVQYDGAGWADIFLSPEFAIPAIFCLVIPAGLMLIFVVYLSKSPASKEEILKGGLDTLSGKK